MSDLTLTINQADVDLIEHSLRAMPGKIAVAQRSAVGKTLDTMRGRIRKSLAHKIGIPQKFIGTGHRGFVRLVAVPTLDDATGILRIFPKNIPVERLHPHVTRHGVTYRLFGETVTEPHAFQAQMRKKMSVARRIGVKLGIAKQLRTHPMIMVRKGAARLPITRLKTTNLVAALNRDGGLSSSLEDAQKVLHTNVQSQISRFLKARAERG